jgi:hypothetical protein
MHWVRNGFVILLLCTWGGAGYATTDGYVGAVYHAHIKRTGGKLVPDEFAATGYRWDDYTIAEVTAKSQQVPAVLGHGLQLIAVLYDMPLDASVEVQVLRPVSDADTGRVPRIHKRSKRLQYSALREAHFFEYVYFFDEDYDLTPGQWEIRVWDGNRILLREYFDVYADVDCTVMQC